MSSRCQGVADVTGQAGAALLIYWFFFPSFAGEEVFFFLFFFSFCTFVIAWAVTANVISESFRVNKSRGGGVQMWECVPLPALG